MAVGLGRQMATDSIVAETAARIFSDLCDPQTINRAADDSWKAPAWAALEEAGLPLAWVPEGLGGSGASLADGFAVMREAGRFALPLPLAETMLAGWLLAQAGVPVPRGAMSCGPARQGERITLTKGGTLSGRLRAVPFAKEAKHLALLARPEDGGAVVVLVEAGAACIADGASIAGDALNAVSLDGLRPVAVRETSVGWNDLQLMGATVRAVQMAGALEAILDLSVAYANERVAFERPIGKFQAIQHNLARLAGEVATAVAAAGSAADAIATASQSLAQRGDLGDAQATTSPPPLWLWAEEGVFLEAASAKIRVGEAAGEGAAIAHQVLGAIGFTREHHLHRFTRRLWAWRDDFGNESHWAVKLGNVVAAEGADGLWPMLAAR
jgi:acyl-CoA dehydrogenase